MPFDPAFTYNQPLDPNYRAGPGFITFDPSFCYDQPIRHASANGMGPILFDPDYSYGQITSPNGVGPAIVVTFDPAFSFDAPTNPDLIGPVVVSFDPCFGFDGPVTPSFTVTSPTAPATPLQSVIQRAINLGYGQTGTLIGTPYRHHRPALNGAISIETWLGSINLSVAQNGNFMKPGKVGNDEWYGYYDATAVAPGDYFTNGERTYFVASQQPLLPYLLVFCERTITLSTVSQTAGGGTGSYGGDASSNGTNLLTAWPASIVQGSRGERGDITLPDDVRSPWWTIRLPATPGLVIQNSMFIYDDLGRRYSISSAEITEYGVRITAKQDQT